MLQKKIHKGDRKTKPNLYEMNSWVQLWTGMIALYCTMMNRLNLVFYYCNKHLSSHIS